jgi:hypothetical protein
VDLRSRLGSGRADVTDRRHGARHHHVAAPRHSPFRLLATCVALTLAATSCGNDDDPPADDESSAITATTATAETTSDEEPPGTDPTAVEPYVEDLLTRYDEVMSQIVADPAIAADREHELYRELEALLVPDAPMTEPIVNALVARGEQGVSQRPYDDDQLPIERAVDGEIVPVNEDEVTFPMCTIFNYRLFDSLDRETEYHADVVQAGTGEAVRIDGHWLIRHLEGNDEQAGCQEFR